MHAVILLHFTKAAQAGIPNADEQVMEFGELNIGVHSLLY